MKFQISIKDGTTYLRIDGQLDALTAPGLRPEIDKVIEGAPAKVEVDLANLRLIDSSGVGALVSLYKRVRAQGGKVEIKGLRDQPLAIFRLLRLDRVLLSDTGRALLPPSKQLKSES